MGSVAQTEAVWVTGPGRAEIHPEAIASPGAGEVRVRTRYSAVSRGSESLVFRGEVPASQVAAMRAPFQAGEFPGPVKYGYISVGEVVAGVPELCGRTVFCLFPHQREYVVPANAVVPVPTAVPAARAVLAANMETAVNALWDGAPAVGERIAVIGAGTVGCLVAYLCARLPGVEVVLVDRNPARQSLAGQLGATFATPSSLAGEFDRLFHASASESGLRQALERAAYEATIIELSWYGSQPVTLPLGEAFHARRLTLRSTQVGGIPPTQRGRWDYRRRMALALRLLADDALDGLISGESPFAELPALLARLSAGSPETLCHRIRYADGG